MSKSTVKITVYYRSVDRFSQSRTFKTLAGAQKYAAKWVGETPDMGLGYAVSFDGVGRIMVKGAPLADLFPALLPAEAPPAHPADAYAGSTDEANARNANTRYFLGGDS